MIDYTGHGAIKLIGPRRDDGKFVLSAPSTIWSRALASQPPGMVPDGPGRAAVTYDCRECAVRAQKELERHA